jgi:hypothetical protein
MEWLKENLKKVLLVLGALTAIGMLGMLFSDSMRSRPVTQTDTISAAPAPSQSTPLYAVKLVGARKGEDKYGDPVVICQYEWTNNSDKATNFEGAFYDKCYENGVECSSVLIMRDFDGETMTNLLPGATYKVEKPYKISANANQIRVIVKEAYSLSDIVYIDSTVMLS